MTIACTDAMARINRRERGQHQWLRDEVHDRLAVFAKQDAEHVEVGEIEEALDRVEVVERPHDPERDGDRQSKAAARQPLDSSMKRSNSGDARKTRKMKGMYQ